MDDEYSPIESHPWEPFVPVGAKVLILGTFPPGHHRWSMDFYYPNPTNDFWRIMALVLLGNSDALYAADSTGGRKHFDLGKCKALMTDNHIALNDTGAKIRRLKGNASDKFLEIVEPVDLNRLLSMMPDCCAIATTGEKAATVISSLTFTSVPAMGRYVISDRGIKVWRMPSTSRAYPLKLEKKAEYYRQLFVDSGISTF